MLKFTISRNLTVRSLFSLHHSFREALIAMGFLISPLEYSVSTRAKVSDVLHRSLQIMRSA